MRIALGADHAGVGLKDQLTAQLSTQGFSREDFGTRTAEAVGYPDFAIRVAREVGGGRFDRGVLVCCSGLGMAIGARVMSPAQARQLVTIFLATPFAGGRHQRRLEKIAAVDQIS